MNWKEIKETCPNAFDKIAPYFRSVSDSGWIKNIEFIGSDLFAVDKRFKTYLSNRELFDFFDENGIFITIDYSFYDCDFLWKFDVTRGDATLFESGERYEDRTEAETASFTKAFELLEKK